MGNLLALDQSSHTSGYAIFSEGKLISYGKFTFDDNDIGDRLYKIREKVKSLIEEYNINFVVFEDIQLQSNVANNVKTFKVLAEVFGVIYELLTELDIPKETVLAGTWKRFLSIKGRARAEQKKEAQNFVLTNYGIKATQDESDAICIGVYYLSRTDCWS